MALTTHHTGCVVESIASSTQHYQSLFPEARVSDVFDISEQQVKVCFIQISSDPVAIELVEPYPSNQTLGKLLKKKQHFYHVGYQSDDFDQEIADLTERGAFVLPSFISPAFHNKRCCFIMTRDQHLIEIIER